MAIDQRRVAEFYAGEVILTGKDRFDYREGRSLTLNKAAEKISTMDLPEGYLTRTRNLVVPVWMNPKEPIYLEWTLHHDRRLIGIVNFDEQARSLPIREEMNDFISNNFKRDNLLAMIAMDKDAKARFIEYQARFQQFNPEYLSEGIALLA